MAWYRCHLPQRSPCCSAMAWRPTWSRSTKGARAAAQANHVEVINVDRRAEQASEVERLLGAGVGALVFVSASGGDQRAPARARSPDRRAVICGGAVPAARPHALCGHRRRALRLPWVSALLTGASDALGSRCSRRSEPMGPRPSVRYRSRPRRYGRGRVIARLAASGKIDQAYEVTRSCSRFTRRSTW